MDRLRMFEVVSNLVRNAIEFSPDGGTITISTEKKDDSNEALVSIKDCGTGISPEIMPRLFT